ncbi:MAG TPA: tyrosine-type recombinase/integrase [Pyrinomonadaceae bacterium]|nr:tyrosine-type recombinase/integrase [Pyrinomonadaceae bacterium]
MQLTQAVAEFMSRYFSTHERSQKTRTAYGSDLEQFKAFAKNEIHLVSVGGSLIEDWATHLRNEGYSPASMRRKMVVLKVFFSYWVRRGVLKESPFWRVRLSFGRIEQLPRALAEEEIKGLLAHAVRLHESELVLRKGSVLARSQDARSSSREYRALRNLALVDLLFATGIRVGEASSLDVDDFLKTETVFRIQGKGGRERLAYVVDERTIRIQRQHHEARLKMTTKSPALFLNASGERLSTQGMANIITQFQQDAGIERHVTPHMLRHTVATLLLRNGMDIRVVQEFLGHASIATTQRYTHVVKEHLIGELRKHHPSLGLREHT